MLFRCSTTKGNCSAKFVLYSSSKSSASCSSGSNCDDPRLVTEDLPGVVADGKSAGTMLQSRDFKPLVSLSRLIDGGAEIDGSVVEAVDSRDTGDLGIKLPDTCPSGIICELVSLDTSRVTRPSSFCSNWATRLRKRSVAYTNANGLGIYVGFDVRVRLRLGRSWKKHCFFKR